MVHLQIHPLFFYDIVMDIYTKIYCVELTDFNKKRRHTAKHIVCGTEYGALVQNKQDFDHEVSINGLNK
jgi:hypothetical protein